MNTEDLARELDLTVDDIQVYVDQLIAVDGRDAVIADQHPTGHHVGSYPIVVTELTDEAAEGIRHAVAAQREG